MPTISEINIKQFRGIKDLEIHSLNRVNLIVGDNNSGKTSVLEALQLFRTSSNLANLYSIARQRESMFGLNSNSIYENFICMFPHDGSDLSIEVNGVCFNSPISFQLLGNQKRVLIDAKDLGRNFLVHNEDLNGELETDIFEGNIDFEYGEMKVHSSIEMNRFSRVSGTLNNSKDAFKIIYVSPFEHLKGNTISLILKNDQYKEICLKALQLFDSEIEDILILRSDIGNRPVEYLKHRKLGMMPLSTFGDGIKKVLVLSNAIARASGGILLVDEIETAIHKKYYDDIFSFIVKACRAFDVQIFISTHSIEAIDGLLATQRYDESNADDIQVITLKKENNRTYSRSLTGKEVYTNREAFGFEVRL